jgi:hypothetical protein
MLMSTSVLCYVVSWIACDLERLVSLSLSFASHQHSRIFFLNLHLLLFSFFLLLFFVMMHHHHYSRRMTTNNNKSDSSPPQSLVPSFNHHRFVSFGSAVSSIINITIATTTAVFSFQLLSMFRPYEQYSCYY